MPFKLPQLGIERSPEAVAEWLFTAPTSVAAAALTLFASRLHDELCQDKAYPADVRASLLAASAHVGEGADWLTDAARLLE
jgi:hypothetical protein